MHFTPHRTRPISSPYTSLEDWLERGPHFLKDQVNEQFWGTYSADVNDILLDPINCQWLKSPIGEFLTPEEQRGYTSSYQRTTMQRRLTSERFAHSRLHIESDLENGQGSQTTISPSQQKLKALFKSKLFTPLATGVFIVNITTALGYAMLMNGPTTSEEQYTPG
jgi:hypothetical protein